MLLAVLLYLYQGTTALFGTPGYALIVSPVTVWFHFNFFSFAFLFFFVSLLFLGNVIV